MRACFRCKVVAENKRPPSKTSAHARFRWWRGGEGGKQAGVLGFDGGGVVRVENKRPPSKTSLRTRFRWWWGGGGEKQAAAIENEPARLFSMMEGW